MSRASIALLFSDSFDADGAQPTAAPPPPQPSAPSLTETDVVAAGEDGYRRGYKAAQSEQAASVAQALATIARNLDNATTNAAKIAEQSVDALGRLVVNIACAACPALRVRFAEENVVAFIRKLLPALAREPLVTFYVHSSLATAVAKTMEKHPGEVEIVAGDDVVVGDATVRWTDGAAYFAAEDVEREIRSVLEEFGLVSADVPASQTTG